jgi:putative FmdB family regulatory protein
MARTGAVETLSPIAGSLALSALTRPAANVALHAHFIHAGSASTPGTVCYDTGRDMPIYEYRCRQCANEFELLILKNSPTPACTACQSEDIEQLLSGFALSSDGISKARLKAARRQLAASSQVKDQKVAEREYFQKEQKEHSGG